MTNFADFWGTAGKKFKVQSASWRTKFKIKEWIISFWKKIKLVFSVIGDFFRRLFRLPKILNRRDKIALLILIAILLGLLGYKFDRDWLSKTKKIPASGGTYQEVLIGEAKYLNPILAKSDTDRTINRLLYSGLTKIDRTGAIVPDLAKDWQISADGKSYTFNLKPGISWHDGAPFTSADVAATIEAIKNQNIKSPYYDSWKDVQVETPSEGVVVFTLPDSYGPFIYNTLVGIIPSHLDSASISSLPVGSGMYKFSKVESGKNGKIKKVFLKSNEQYFDQKPFISEVVFEIADDEETAKDVFNSRGTTAIAGVKVEGKEINNYSFSTSRYFGLIFNLHDDKFKDESIRKKISTSAKAGMEGKVGEKFEPEFEFRLLTLDKPLPLTQAEEIKSNFAQFGIKVNIDKKSAIDYQKILEKRSFQVLLYGFDAGYDRDPYPFWHSSQAASGTNFSGFSDKAADILLEDARMTVDGVVRNQKYDQFFAIINDKVPAIFYPSQEFQLSIKNSVFGIETLKGNEPQDHLNSIADWYIKTKRVKP